MKIYYHPETDSVAIYLKDGAEGVVGEIMGEDLNENVVLHRDDAGTLYEIEVVGDARSLPLRGRRTPDQRNARKPSREQGSQLETTGNWPERSPAPTRSR